MAVYISPFLGYGCVTMILNEKRIRLDEVKKILELKEPTCVTLDIGNQFVSFFFKPHFSRDLVILSPGAKSKKISPEFQRVSYAEEIEANVIILTDPTWDSGCRIGWMQGNSDIYFIETFVDMIKNLIEGEGFRLIFFGSSAGGFTSLVISSYFDNSSVIAINSQVDIFKYKQKQYVRSLLLKGFSMHEEEYITVYNGRNIVINSFIKNNLPKIYYYQNISDHDHYYNHYLLFDNIMRYHSESIYTCIYRDDNQGHNPPGKKIELSIINNVIVSPDSMDSSVFKDVIYEK